MKRNYLIQNKEKDRDFFVSLIFGYLDNITTFKMLCLPKKSLRIVIIVVTVYTHLLGLFKSLDAEPKSIIRSND